MIITPHFLVGAALGAVVKNVPAAFVLGIASHLVLDRVPHTDQGTFDEAERGEWPKWFYYIVAMDAIATIVIMLFFKKDPNFKFMIAGGLGAILIDVLDNFPIRNLDNVPFFKQIHFIHHKFHYYIKKENWPWGLIGPVVAIGGSLWFLLKKF